MYFEMNLPTQVKLVIQPHSSDAMLSIVRTAPGPQGDTHVANILQIQHNPYTGFYQLVLCDNIPQDVPLLCTVEGEPIIFRMSQVETDEQLQAVGRDHAFDAFGDAAYDRRIHEE